MGVILLNMLDKKAGTTWLLTTLLLIVSVSSIRAEDDTVLESEREPKVLPIFQVVKFPNDVCSGSSYNGTCYTAEECSSKGGTNEGSCASGFGVCCTFALSCGDSSSQNQTYLVQSSVTSLTSPCTYTICKCSTNICRIRFDFTTFVLATAVAGTTVSAANTAAGSQIGTALGDCTTDQFSITSPGNQGTPIICGSNGGYHMIVDASSDCSQATFNIGALTTTSRKWTIRVTQYACGDYDMSGWPGCLQYYTSTASTIQNFAFPTSATTVTSGVTHLSNQKYDICIRRAKSYCYICYSEWKAGTAVIAQGSFGLSVSPSIASQAGTNTACTSDYIAIPYGNSAAIAAITAPATEATFANSYCGRFFSIASGATAGVTVCSRRSPFTVGVNFDSNEVTSISVADAKASTRETSEYPGGITGFKLIYFQVAC